MSNKVLVETSACHVHLTREHVDILFGAGHQLTHKKDLSQPGQFACEERVTVVGPKNEIKNVIVLGPERKASQVEVSLTDARTLGVNAPVRESGDVAHPVHASLLAHVARLSFLRVLLPQRDISTSHRQRLRQPALAISKLLWLRLKAQTEQQSSAMLWLEFIQTSALLCILTQMSLMLLKHLAQFTAKLLNNFFKNNMPVHKNTGFYFI